MNPVRLTRRQLLLGAAGAAVLAPVMVAVASEGFSTATMTAKCRELVPRGFYSGPLPLFGDSVLAPLEQHQQRYSTYLRQSLDQTMREGLERVWSEVYASHSTDWEAVFGPEQLTLF